MFNPNPVLVYLLECKTATLFIYIFFLFNKNNYTKINSASKANKITCRKEVRKRIPFHV